MRTARKPFFLGTRTAPNFDSVGQCVVSYCPSHDVASQDIVRIVKQGSACEESRRGQNATASRQAWVKQLKDDVRAQEEGAAWHQEIQQALLLLFVASRPAQAVVVVVVVNQF